MPSPTCPLSGSLNGLIDTDGPLVTLVGLDNVGVIVRDGRALVVNLESSQDVKHIVTQLKLENRTDGIQVQRIRLEPVFPIWEL